MPATGSELSTQARRILLLKIAGEVDPSAKKAASEFLTFTRFAGKAIDDVAERQRVLTSTAEQFIQVRYPEVWKEYTKAMQESGSAMDALKKKTEQAAEAIIKGAEASKLAKEAALAEAAAKKALAIAAKAQAAAAKAAAQAAKAQAAQKAAAAKAAKTAQALATKAAAAAAKAQAKAQAAAAKVVAQAAKAQAAAVKKANATTTKAAKAAAAAQKAALQKQQSAWMNFITMLRSGNVTILNVVKSLKLGTVALMAFSAGLVVVGAKGVLKGIATTLTRIGQLGKRVFSALKSGIMSLAAESLKLNEGYQQTETVFVALARSEELASDFLHVLREEAIASGNSFVELADKAKLLVPFSGGSIDRFRELLKLTTRLQAIRPDLGVQSATRALMQFLTGTNVTLSRLYGIPTELIKQIKDAGYEGAEAMDALLTQFGVGEELVKSLSNTWSGLTKTIKDFAQRTLLNLTNPAFEAFNELLKDLVTWLRDNRGQIRAFTVGIGQDIGDLANDITAAISGPEGFGEDTIFKAADWGIRLITSLTHGILNGINTVLIPAMIILGEAIASFLKGASPPLRGVLSTIDRWFGPVLRAYLSGFSADDFSALNDIGNIIQAGLKTALAADEISQEEFVRRMVDARGVIVTMVEELRRFGTISAGVWGQIQEAAGLDIQLIQGYLDLLKQVRIAQERLADAINRVRAAEAAYAREMEKVRAIQEELRMFDLTTSEIPERYKRGRRRELEFKLIAAQKQARVQQEALNLAREQQKAAQTQLNTAKQSLSIYKQMLTQLGQLANEIAKLAGDEDGFPWDADEAQGLGDTLEALQGRFKDLRKTWEESFAPIKKDFEFLVNFFKGLVGIPAPRRPGMPEAVQRRLPPPAGYEAGQRLNEVFKTLGENAGKVGEGILDIVEGLAGITEWYEGQPQWVKDILSTSALVIAVNWATGGLGTSLLTMLAGAGLALKGGAIAAAAGSVVAWSLPVVVSFAIVYGLVELLARIAKALGLEIPTPGEFIMHLKTILEFDAQSGVDFVNSVLGLIEQIGIEWQARFPWFKFLVDLPTKAGEFVEKIQTPPSGHIGWGEAPDKADGEVTALTWLQGIWNTLTGKKTETEAAVKEGLIDPLVGGAEDIERALVSRSIFPDMVDEINKLFVKLGKLLARQMDRIVVMFRYAGQSMMQWWIYHMTTMGVWADYLTGRLGVLLKVLERTLYMLQQVQTAVQGVTIKVTSGTLPEFQSGGIVRKLETALVHPGELILNIGQQRNVAAALAGVGAGLGGGAISPGALSINQNFSFQGALTTAEKKEYKRIARDAVTSIFDAVRVRQRED